MPDSSSYIFIILIFLAFPPGVNVAWQFVGFQGGIRDIAFLAMASRIVEYAGADLKHQAAERI